MIFKVIKYALLIPKVHKILIGKVNNIQAVQIKILKSNRQFKVVILRIV